MSSNSKGYDTIDNLGFIIIVMPLNIQLRGSD